MACRTWSLQAGIEASGMCTVILLPESSNQTKSCQICVTPIEMPVVPPPE